MDRERGNDRDGPFRSLSWRLNVQRGRARKTVSMARKRSGPYAKGGRGLCLFQKCKIMKNIRNNMK